MVSDTDNLYADGLLLYPLKQQRTVGDCFMGVLNCMMKLVEKKT